jgi:hypothetical protein
MAGFVEPAITREATALYSWLEFTGGLASQRHS